MKAWFLEKKRRIILLGLLIVAIPILGLALYVYLEVIDILKEHARAEVQTYSSQAANSIEARLKSHIAYGRAYAARPHLIEGLVKRVRDGEEYIGMEFHLKDLVEGSNGIEMALLVSNEGRGLASYPQDLPLIGMDFSRRNWFKGVSREWQPYVSEFFLRAGTVMRRYIFAIAVPVKAEDGRPIGIIAMQPNVDYIRDALSEIELKNGLIYVVDRNGNLIYHPGYTVDRIIDFSKNPAVEKVKKDLSGTERARDPETGEWLIAAYHPVEKWGWGVIAEIPDRVVFAPVRKITLTLIAFTGFMLLIGGFFAYLAALQTSEIVRSRLYIEKMIDPLWVLDQENLTVDINPAFTRLFGYSREEMLGRSVFEFLDEENHAVMVREFEKRNRGESSTYEVEIRTKNGAGIPVLLSGSPLIDRGRVVGKIGVIKDIREQKRLEAQVKRRAEELEEANRRLTEEEHAERAYNEFLTLLNRQWADLAEMGDVFLRKINEHTCIEAGVLYLYELNELVPLSTFAIRKPAISGGLPYEAVRQRKTLGIRDIPEDTYLRVETGAGVFIPKDILALPLIYLNEPVGLLELACIHGLKDHDERILERISPQLAIGINTLQNQLELKRLSDEISQSNEELQEMNEELQTVNEELHAQQQELAEANRRIAEASRAKSDFLANMSHELRTPLNSIIGFSEILQDSLYGELNEKQQEYVDDILSSGRHLLSLINDILDLAKVESGKVELELGSFPLRDVLDSSLVMFKEKAMKHRIRLSLDVELEADVEIEADARKLKQVMFNLLSNALKFTPDGGAVTTKACHLSVVNGHLYTEDREKIFLPVTIDNELVMHGDFVRISVEDTGIGVKEEDIPRLFQEFTQLESSYTKKYEGTGLGLALTRRLVELHGGRIWVESEYGKGSRFTFVIPVSQEEREISLRADKEEKVGHGDVAVAIDDDPMTLSIVDEALKAEGYTLITASDGEAGLEAIRKERPGLVLLDLVMPGMNGFKVVDRLKSEAETASIPVVILTAASLSDDDKKRLEGRIRAVIEKGRLTREEFIREIKRLV